MQTKLKLKCTQAMITIADSMVIGIHNYYCHATMVATDCEKINWDVQKVMKNRLYSRLKRKGAINGGINL